MPKQCRNAITETLIEMKTDSNCAGVSERPKIIRQTLTWIKLCPYAIKQS